MQDERLAQIALSLIPGIGSVLARNLISYCGSALEIFKKSPAQLSKIPGISIERARLLKAPDTWEAAEACVQQAKHLEVQILSITDSAYPKRLKQIFDAPPILFYKGKTELNPRYSIAIVGTRKATEYGKSLLDAFIADIAPLQPQIISGLAYGIDIHAHRLALQHGLETLGVVANGLDIIYPSLHKETVHKMYDHGGTLSEYGFGVKPDHFRFPARNRLIAGLADVTVVVEAAEKGGALITAHLANDYSREVATFPGRVEDKYSAGCLNLVKQNKAHLITEAKDLMKLMNWDLPEEYQQSAISTLPELPPEEEKIFLLLQEFKAPLHVDKISWHTEIPVHQVASCLLSLEFQGLVKSLPGKMYQRARG